MIELQIRYFPSEAHFEWSESMLNMMFERLRFGDKLDWDKCVQGLLDED